MRVKQEARVTAGELLKTNQQFLQQQQAAEELKDKRDARMRKWMNWVIEAPKKTVSSWLLIAIWAIVCAGWGWVGGINTPEWILCSKQRSLCYQARFRGGNVGKQAVDMLPKSQCVRTSRGVACLLGTVHKTQPKKQRHR